MMKLVAVCVTIFALGMVALAKETSLRTKDHGVLGAMHRMECKSDWLSVVLRRSDILESELNSLPVGTRIVMPDECGTMAPAKADVTVTRKLVAREHEYLAAKETQKELNKKLDEAKVALDKADKLSKNLERDSQIMTSHFKELERKILKGRDRVRIWWDIDVFIGVFIFILILVWRLWVEKKAKAKLEEEIVELRLFVVEQKSDYCFAIEYHGDIVQFRDTTEHYAGCPHCPESRIKPDEVNLRQHLDKHTRLRVVEIPADEMRKYFSQKN
jgi:hypothetical protein